MKNSPFGIYLKCLLLVLFSASIIISEAQNKRIDSLYAALKTQKDDTNKVRTLNALSWDLDNMSLVTEADSLNKISLPLAEKLNYKAGIAMAHVDIGNVYWSRSNFQEALAEFLKALEIAKKLNAKRIMSNAYSYAASMYRFLGNYPQALSYNLTALKIEEELGSKLSMARSYINIGNIYIEIGNADESLKNYNKALELSKALNDKSVTEACYLNIGAIYLDKKDYANALLKLSECLKLAEELKDEFGLVTIYENMANVYQAQNDYTTALQYYNKSLSVSKSIGYRRGVCLNLYSIGIILIKQGKHQQSKSYIDSTLMLAKKIGSKDLIKKAYEVSSLLDSTEGNYRGAFNDYKNYIVYRDSLTNEANTKKLVQEQMQYEFDKKQAAEKAEQDKKDAIAAQESKKQLIIRNFFIAGFVLVLALAFFIFRGYRQKQKANEIIIKQKQEVEQQKELVEEKQKEILDSIHYAQRIQKALLASDALLKQNLPDYFVLYKPKDIVSGDFYWATKKDDKFYLAVCDSTGHGVPGAFMSLLNTSFLNEAINEKNITNPNEVFNHARKRLIENISQDGQQDGMDGVIASLYPSERRTILRYAAAYNAPVVVRNGELIELNADKIPVGRSPKENESFNLHSFNLQKGDVVYAFTDGFADQFGGEKGKKLKYKQLLELIKDNVQLGMPEQKQVLEKAFEDWKGSLEQVDDVLVVGIRI